ncbi:MAG: FmdB family transcriptional regulator [Opitutaceae bacterium]
MPIYEYYCPEHHTIYQFFAKTLAQGKIVPRCPEDPKHRLKKAMSAFAVTGGGKKSDDAARAESSGAGAGDAADDPRMEAAMGAMEKEFANVGENDPRAMGRMMRRMAEISGEKIEGEMEEVVRKLEEGADPEALEEQLGGENPCSMEDPDARPGGEKGAKEIKEARHRFRIRKLAPTRDPKLYDF